MIKTKLLISFISLGLMLSSCDKKNAFLINRRTATPEKIREIEEAQKKSWKKVGRKKSRKKMSMCGKKKSGNIMNRHCQRYV
ncbi:hypothetical protein AGMMS49950_10660 [Endomicrobiia bacterium]|nr:hypothetical protein AGMMS49950_10660 [Endomicrobiia bacterium]